MTTWDVRSCDARARVLCAATFLIWQVLCVLWAALLEAKGLTSEGLFRIAPAGSEKEALLKARPY